MKHPLLQVNEVYKIQASHLIGIHEIQHERFEEFCRQLPRFHNLLEEDASDEHWRQYLATLYAYRNRLAQGLLSFNALVKPEEIERVERLTEKSKHVFPQYYEAAVQVTQLYRHLTELRDNPLFERLISLEPRTDTLNIALGNQSYSECIKKLFYARCQERKVRFITASAARRGFNLGWLVLLGPPYFYPKHLFTAPRAGRIDVVSYAWLDNELELGLDFGAGITYQEGQVGGSEIFWDKVVKRSLSKHSKLKVHTWKMTPEEDRLLWKTESESATSPAWEKVTARLYRLANDKAVLLEQGEKFSSDVLWLAGSKEVDVCRVKHRELEVGNYLLLRTAKDHNHVLEMSRQFLGDEAESYFASHQVWKRRLRNLLSKHRMQTVIRHLRNNGSKRAKEINLRNWANEDTIGPRDLEEFSILLRVLKLEDRLKEFWEAAKKIHEARIRAGFQIRENLCRLAMSTDLAQLEMEGEYCFQLPDEVGGSMTAFRIEGISEQKLGIARQYVRVVMDLNDY